MHNTIDYDYRRNQIGRDDNGCRENYYRFQKFKRGKNAFSIIPLCAQKVIRPFVVNTKDNLWYDSRSRDGGNLINLVEKLNSKSVKVLLENQIREKNLQFNEDYNARIKEEEEEKQQWLRR